MLLKKKRPTLRASLVPVATLLMGPTVTPPWEGERFQFLKREDVKGTPEYTIDLGEGPFDEDFDRTIHLEKFGCFVTGKQTSRHV